MSVKMIALALALTLTAWAAEPAQYSPDAGLYKVLTVKQMVLHDAARHKQVRLKIYYPEGPGPFPISARGLRRS